MVLLRTGRQSYSGVVLKAVFSVAVLASLVDAQSKALEWNGKL